MQPGTLAEGKKSRRLTVGSIRGAGGQVPEHSVGGWPLLPLTSGPVNAEEFGLDGWSALASLTAWYRPGAVQGRVKKGASKEGLGWEQNFASPICVGARL